VRHNEFKDKCLYTLMYIPFTIPLKYTRFERARIIGARALQISMGAPVLIEIPEGVTDPVRIAELEFEEGAIPITVRREG